MTSRTLARRLGRLRSAVATLVCALGAALALGRPAGAGEALQKVEREFQQAIAKVTPATVTCGAKEPPAGAFAPRSSGVIVSRRGLVLSDGDVGSYFPKEGRGAVKERGDVVEVRVPDLKRGGFASYRAHVVRRIVDLDSTLLRIDDPPPAGFPAYLAPGTSDGLQVGDFSFAMGNSFQMSDEMPPSLTAGVIAAMTDLPPSSDASARSPGRYESVYTSAAVNEGVNGGPLADVEGRLVATVSGRVQAQGDRTPDPYVFLGKAVPIDRIRAAYADLPEAAELFAEGKPVRERSKESSALESAFHGAATKASPCVVSLAVTRKADVKVPVLAGRQAVVRYTGPVSGLLLARDGTIVTSLYNLTSLATLEDPPAIGVPIPAGMSVEEGLADVVSVVAHLPDGRDLPAKLVGHDPRLGIAVLQAELPAPAAGGTAYALPEAVPAPAESLQEGRFVLALGNPFGPKRHGDPLLTVGILSKRHGEVVASPWAGEWETDAGGTDGNCGGAAVDLQGRVIGLLTIWSPSRHGRNSGIAFVVPLDRVLRALPAIRAGNVPTRGFLGIAWKGGTPVSEPIVESVVEAGPAARAGIQVGDLIVAIEGEPVGVLIEASNLVRFRWAGDRLHVAVRRGDKTIETDVVLGTRPAP